MTRSHDHVTVDLIILLVQSPGPAQPLAATMRYDRTDPFAVALDIHSSPTTVVTWTFARDLLQQGVYGPAGDGDIEIWPANLHGGPISLSLSGPTGKALFETPRRKVLTFLTHTYTVVPLGAESQNFDVDAFIAPLTGHDSVG
ncbi:SsgA family sporulation/cell division regulator [Frankia sp. AgB1.9]|uniref:SsgA family sporulation/cell division regulator n=1 Tax=unclassified Frankia TaxID=2632575 RepID=UPI00193207AC|nr:MULTISPECIES: SsgA family sporulation/cell division regulator [unclassified Frankia]MBL7488004.1 SsgA family sporulation/cell division regulator [Frankia sp. AgW1.1]MBL7549442.1 SsgA family sporulation/cell division regulator [Frankia sp. AgB1.9]MBL7619942.1 SsgA family sporulation/cell division regulator [Frankia sp. AgB1.8]